MFAETFTLQLPQFIYPHSFSFPLTFPVQDQLHIPLILTPLHCFFPPTPSFILCFFHQILHSASPPKLLIHFLPFTEVISYQLHFSLQLNKDTKLQI